MSNDVRGSDSDSDSDWNEELINAVKKKEGRLEVITEENRISRVQECLNEGADVNAVDKNKNTALHFAVKKGYAKVVRFLVEQGAKADIPNKSSQTALTLAHVPGKEEILSALKRLPNNGSQLLLTQPTSGADPTVKDAGQDLKRKDIADSRGKESVKKQRFDSTGVEDEDEEAEVSFWEDSQPESDDDVVQRPSRFNGSNEYGASGLKQTLHGNIYQLKLLMLFLERGLREGYAFRLATEMDVAEKFDDLVFQYENKTANGTVYRFLQAKHKQDETKTIGVRDLLTEQDDEFSLQKYFISYCKMKRRPELSGSAFKDFILCTNIDFDFKGLELANIHLKRVVEPDHFLDFENSTRRSARYKFLVDQRSEILYKILERTAEAYTVAKMLVELVLESKDITLRNDIFKLYHTALAREVIDVENKQFSADFVSGNNLSERAESFRKIFYAEAVKRTKLPEDTPEDTVWKMMTRNQLKVSSTFGQKFELLADPELTDVDRFTEELLNLIKAADNNDLVKVNRKIYRKNAREGSNEKILADNIDKLAGHVLILEGERIKFRSQFLDDSVKLRGNMEDLRKSMQARLGSRYKDLARYSFEIKNFKTCEEDQLHSKTELPGDDVKSEDIADFFDKLIFAVNQPNEIQLGDVISGEIAADSQFNLLNADLVGASFQTEMLDWFKEKGKEKGKEGRFFSAEDGRAFFDAAERKVNTLVSSGLGLAYPEELRGFGIEFRNENEELRDFLIGTKPALNVIATEETLPTAIRVHRAIRRSGKFSENDSLIFLHLCTLMLPGIRKRVIRAFESPHSHHLIVIDCGAVVKRNLQKLYNRLCQTTRKHVGKKVILISRADSGDSEVRFENCREIYDHVRFGDLAIESRYKLMGKLVINFQGRRGSTSIGKLLGIRSCGELAAWQELTNFAAAIDTGTLMKLIRGEEIKVGSDPKGLGEIENYYINRRIDRQVVIKIDILKSSSTFDLFAISGADKEVITGLADDEEKVQRFDEIDREKRHLVKFVILDTEKYTEQFESLCRESSRNVHWLNWEWGKLIWIKSHQGNIGTLVAHRDIGYIRGLGDLRVDKTRRYWLDDDLVDHVKGREDLVVISDDAGMGKTTLFTYLGKILKRKTPESWVIVINLNDFTDVLQKELKSQSFNGSDVNGAVEFFVEHLSNLENNLEKTVLRMIMKNRNGAGVALLFDGFDEISPEYEKTVIDVLLAFQKIGVAKLLVATRPHMRGALEEKLGIFSYAIEPFSEENQFEFLVRFWKRGLGWKDIDERIGERLNTYARSVIKTVVRSIDDWVKEFAGIPLQTRMIAEVFQDDRERKVDFETCEEFLRSTNDEPRLPGKMNIIDMYGRFVDKKYYIYRTEKKKEDVTNLGTKRDSQHLREIFLKRHEKLALHTLFSAKGFPTFLGPPALPLLLSHHEIEGTNAYLGEIIQGEERSGIITRVVNGKAEFIHRTFAEYFAAIFLLNTLIAMQTDHDPNVLKFIVKVILSEHSYKIIRSFLNGLIQERHLLSDTRYAVDSATIGAWKSVLQGCHDEFGQTIFHRAATEQNYDTVKYILNRFDGYDEARRDLINVKDYFGMTVLHVVAVGRRPPKQLPSLEGKDVASESNPLVDSYNNLPMVEWLVENGALVDVLSNDAQTPYFIAAGSGNLDVLKWLIENRRVGINDRNKYGKTILHYAASAGQLEVVKWLVNVKEADLSARVNDGKTVLHEAAAHGQWGVVKWLILEEKIDVDSKGNNNWTVLRVAATSGNLEMVEWLVERGADVNAKSSDGNTVLHMAASERRWAVLKLLVEKGADVNAKSWVGNTVLHQAAFLWKWDLVEWLIKVKGSDFKAKGTDDVTVLHQAARGNRWDLVKWLLEEKDVDVDTFSLHEGTVLHIAAAAASASCSFSSSFLDLGVADSYVPNLAASRNEWDTVRWLVEERGADVNIRPPDGMTVLHLAAKVQKWDIVSWLVLDRGADVDTRASDGLTLLHRAASFGQTELVKSLVEDKGTDIAAGSNDGRTVLHFAAASGEMPLVKWLVKERRVDVGARSHRGETALHRAAWGGQWQVVRYLANSPDVDVGVENSNGQTVLLIAIELGNCEMIQWLVEEKGLEVNAKFADGKTIVNYAVASGQLNVVQWLVADMGADVTTKDNNGQTILNEAITAGRGDIFKWLVEVGGADINTRDDRGGTLLHAASAAVDIDMIRLLVTSYNIDVSLTDDNNKTALELYCNNHRRRYEADQAVLHLLRHGTATSESTLIESTLALAQAYAIRRRSQMEEEEEEEEEFTLGRQSSRRASWRSRALASRRRTRNAEERKIRRSMQRFNV